MPMPAPRHRGLLCAATVIAACRCGAASFPDYPVRPAREFTVSVKQSGLSIGVKPLDDPEEQKLYFKTELRSKGFLPVFVVLDNQTTADSFVLRKENISYGPEQSAYGGTGPVARSKTGEGVAMAGAIAISLPAIFIGLKMIAKGTEIQQNILKKELRSLTLSPGASSHGFLFVPVAKGSAPREKIHLRVPVSRIGGDESVDLDLVF